MSTITKRALRVYAALSELNPNSDDVLDALLPFFEPVLEIMNGKIFRPDLFALGIRKLYRWNFTKDIAEQIIPRLLKAGYLAQKVGGERSIYHVKFQPNVYARESEVSGIVENLISLFQTFLSTINSVNYPKFNREKLTDILIRFLVSLDVYHPDSFQNELSKVPLSAEEESELTAIPEGGEPLSSEERYLCARFLKHVVDTRADLVSHLARLASIGLLTEVVEDFLHPVSRNEISDLTIIVDAPLALDYIGCSGTAVKEDVRQIFDSMRRVGCKLVVLPVSLDEMQRNLQTMLSSSNTRRHGPTYEAIVRREISEDFAKAIANNPQKAVENVDMQVRQIGLEHLPSQHKYFPRDRYEDCFESIKWVQQVEPREHDATCMAITMRLREGRNSSDLFKCRYVFVTRNPRFASFARGYCISSGLLYKAQEGPVITQREMATQAWLRTGLGNDEAVPRGQLLLACDQVLRVRPQLKDAIVDRLRSIVPEKAEEMALLMQDQKSLRRLADETFNDEKIITDENAELLFETIKAQALEPERKAFADELEAEKKAASDQRSQFESRIEEMEREQQLSLRAIEDRLEAIERLRIIAVEQSQRDHELKIANVRRLADEVSRSSRRIDRLFICMLLALLLMSIVNFFTGWLAKYQIWSVVLPAALFIFSAYHQVMNFLGKPKIGLSTLLAKYAQSRFIKSVHDFQLIGIVDLSNVKYIGGKVSVPDSALKPFLPGSPVIK